MSIQDFKFCPKCGENKNKSEYHTRKDKGYLYLKSYCKQCCNNNKKNEYNYQKDECHCGAKKTKKSKCCKKCRSIEQTKYETIGDLRKHFIKKYGPAYAYNVVRERARKLNKETKCQKCGYDKHVEVCHIKPISSFSDDTVIETVNQPENILILCPNCHWEFDNTNDPHG
jgi:hypothetical protein